MDTENTEKPDESKPRITFCIEENETPIISLTDYTILNTHIDVNTFADKDYRLSYDELCTEMTVYGKILMSETQEDDLVLKLINWAVLPAFDKGCYKKVYLCIKDSNNVLLREETFQEAFVEYYYEEFDCKTGTGEFLMIIKKCNRALKPTDASS